MLRVLLSGLCAFMINISRAQLVLPACFTDNMVLQQQTKVNLWGTQTPGKNFTVITSWNNKTYQVMADADGTITTLKNILIGEVWVCSGQSNMEMPLTGFYGDVLNLKDELADAANDPGIRMLILDHKTSFTALSTVPAKGGWAVCNPQTVRDFSAVGSKPAFRVIMAPCGSGKRWSFPQHGPAETYS